MNDGRIEQAATPREVFERPATAFVARFMGDHNVISGTVTGSDRRAWSMFDVPSGGTLRRHRARRSESGAPVDIAIRTDHVRIGEPPAPRASASPASSPTSNIAAPR